MSTIIIILEIYHEEPLSVLKNKLVDRIRYQHRQYFIRV